MKLRGAYSAGRLLRRLRAADSVLREAALDAAAEALRGELARESGSAIVIATQGARRSVGSTDISDAAREFGTLEQAPSPWLAPVLPLALEPMRAAANVRVREVFAAHVGNKKAAARALSGFGNRKK